MTITQMWDDGNDAGLGFNVDLEALDVPVEVEEPNTDRQVAVYRDGDRYIAVGDVYGAWAVDITDAYSEEASR